MNQTSKTLGQMVEEIIQAKYEQEAEWKRLAEADQQLQGLTLWTIPDLVEALTRGRAHIAPGPEPDPDWLDARAVLADCDCNAGERTVYVCYSEIAWTCTDCDNPINPEDMKNVTPLYPKENTLHDAPRTYNACLNYDGPWGTRLGGDPA